MNLLFKLKTVPFVLSILISVAFSFSFTLKKIEISNALIKSEFYREQTRSRIECAAVVIYSCEKVLKMMLFPVLSN